LANLISHYYDRYVAPLAKPEEQREAAEKKRFYRQQSPAGPRELRLLDVSEGLGRTRQSHPF
jgi:hypothetical protein